MLNMNGVKALVEGAVRIIEVEEVQCVVNQMKIRKASGPSGVAI